jgi:phage gpG-like protein
MSGIGYTIELDSAELDAMIARAINEAHDMRRPMGEIAEEWLDLVHERFDQEKDPFGVPWAKRRDNVDPDRKVLHLTGALENQIVPDFGPDYAQVGLPTGGPGIYGRIHNEGA